MNLFGISKEYKFSIIESCVNEKKYDMCEYGKFLVGENFIVIKDTENDRVCSFMLTGIISFNSIWKCIYNDFK